MGCGKILSHFGEIAVFVGDVFAAPFVLVICFYFVSLSFKQLLLFSCKLAQYLSCSLVMLCVTVYFCTIKIYEKDLLHCALCYFMQGMPLKIPLVDKKYLDLYRLHKV